MTIADRRHCDSLQSYVQEDFIDGLQSGTQEDLKACRQECKKIG